MIPNQKNPLLLILILIFTQFYLPAGYKREHYSTGSLVLDNKLVMMSFDNKGVHEECQVDSFSGYHIPQRIKYVWQGTTIPSSSSSSNTTTESSLLIKKEEASSTTAPAAETSTMTLATPAAVDESSTEALAASIESINISNNNITLEEEKPQSCRVELVVECQRLCDKIDVLGQLPYLLRKFIQTFITAPFVYQWYEEAEATITFGSNGERRVIKGNVFFETTHLQH